MIELGGGVGELLVGGKVSGADLVGIDVFTIRLVGTLVGSKVFALKFWLGLAVG
jgi:hypothetical protein